MWVLLGLAALLVVPSSSLSIRRKPGHYLPPEDEPNGYSSPQPNGYSSPQPNGSSPQPNGYPPHEPNGYPPHERKDPHEPNGYPKLEHELNPYQKPHLYPYKQSCCYNNTKVYHGEVVLSIPECCLQLVCVNGSIEERSYANFGSNVCCEFNEVLYPENSVLPGQCLSVVCRSGRWAAVGTINECCGHCCLHDDPHIYTFDGYQYDYHEACNYSIAQSDFSHSPQVGVFNEFVTCSSVASCIGITVFRDNPNTILTLDPTDLDNILVNGAPTPVPAGFSPSPLLNHPVLVWRLGSCVIYVGSSKITLRLCRYRLDVWAYPIHLEYLDGLCGHFSDYVLDDFTDRQGIQHPLTLFPNAFPASWLAATQNNRHCHIGYGEHRPETVPNPCRATEDLWRRHLARCRRFLQQVIGGRGELNTHIDTCAFDVCVMHQNGENDVAIQAWIRVLMNNVRHSIEVLERNLGNEIIENPDILPQ